MELLTEIQVRDLAATLHSGQVDKAGRPYIEHLARVVCILKDRWPDVSLDEIAAGWLHDAIEDTGATAESLLASGVSEATVRAVQAVTRPPGTTYLAWIAELSASGERAAIRVKLADNQDNRDPARVAVLTDGAQRVATRYEPARRLLEAGLARFANGGG